MPFQYWVEGLIFIGIFAFVIAVPCVGTALIGYRLMNELGRYPSEAPRIQKSLVLRLLGIQIVSYLLLLGFYRIFQESL